MLDTQQKRTSISNMTMPFRLGRAVPNAFVDLDDRLSLLGLYSRVRISFDRTSNSGYQAASSSYSWSHTRAGGRGFLVVSVSMLSAIGNSVSSITYNGVALTLINTKASASGAVRTEMWGLVNPSSGSNTIAVTLASSTLSIAIATSWAGVNQTTPTEAFNGATATNVGAADATVDIVTTIDHDYVLDIVASDDTAITAASDQVSRANVTGAAASGASSTHNVPVNPAATITQSYTNVGAAATWVISALGIIPADESTVYFLNASSQITPIASLIRQANKNYAGNLTPVGILLKVISRIYSGGITPVGTLLRQANKTLLGTIVSSGVVTKQANTIYSGQVTPSGGIIKQADKNLSGSITPSGNLIRQVNKLLAGTIVLSGTIVNAISKVLSGAIVLSGNLIRQANINLGGAITPTSVLANLKLAVLSLSGSITPSGNLAKQVSKSLSGAITLSGNIIKQINTAYSGVIIPTGNIIKNVSKFLQGTIGLVGNLVNVFIPAGSVTAPLVTMFKGMYKGMFKRMK